MMRIPTTKEIADRNLANLEVSLNQTTPSTPKAFNRILAATLALGYTELSRLVIERAKQTLALTAGEEDLELLGEEYGVTRTPSRAAQLIIEASADPGTEVTTASSFTGVSNQAKYWPNETGSESGGKIVLTVTAELPGVSGNLLIDDTLLIDVEITGVGLTWVVTEVVVQGLDEEGLESYRRRVLNEIRTVGGGSNKADYRTWGEAVAGVYRIFPYSGAPIYTILGFEDGDMEIWGDVSAWSAGNNATLSKSTTDPQAGSQCLLIAYNGTSNPYAYQIPPLTIGKYYTITGYGKGNGTDSPLVKNGSTTLWTGTSSTSWQSFSLSFEADDTEIAFYGNQTAAGSVYFDTIDIIQDSFPGDCTVFVEADVEIDADGLADDDLLTDVRGEITTDPNTGLMRPALGSTDENLYILSIFRTAISVEIRNLNIDTDVETQTKALISTAVDDYFRGIAPHCVGLDPQRAKNDVITDLTLSQVIQDILTSVGASATGIGVYIDTGVFLATYTLGQGELAKLGTITYV